MNSFDRMKKQLRIILPFLSEKDIQYAANIISNQLRKVNYDIYQVEVQRFPFEQEQGYYVYFDIKVRDITIHVKVTVD